MSKAIVKRKNTRIDMTAMSDVTVLLLTFFMLTSTFVQKEPIMVAIPASVSEIKIPETNILQILVDTKGKIFLSLDKNQDKEDVLKKMGEQYGIRFTDVEVNKFKLIKSFGIPIGYMKRFMALKSEEQDAIMTSYGIPCDSTNNEFKEWVRNACLQNKDLRIAIKADQLTPYSQIKNIMKSLQDIHQNRYNLITSLKTVTAQSSRN